MHAGNATTILFAMVDATIGSYSHMPKPNRRTQSSEPWTSLTSELCHYVNVGSGILQELWRKAVPNSFTHEDQTGKPDSQRDRASSANWTRDLPAMCWEIPNPQLQTCLLDHFAQSDKVNNHWSVVNSSLSAWHGAMRHLNNAEGRTVGQDT